MRQPKASRDFLKLTIYADDTTELEESLLKEGCKEPLVIWNGFLVDGYKRLVVCKKHMLKYKTEELQMDSMEEAILWACEKRCTMTKVGTHAHKYIHGKMYLLGMENEKDPSVKKQVAQKIADKLGIRSEAVNTYGRYAKSIDAWDNQYSEFVDAIMQNRISMGRENLRRFSEMNEEEFYRAVRTIMRSIDADDVPMRTRRRKTKSEKEIATAREQAIPLQVGIKNTPEYDPDVDVKSMMYTLSSWSSALRRGMERLDIHAASYQTIINLRIAIRELKAEIEKTLEGLEK